MIMTPEYIVMQVFMVDLFIITFWLYRIRDFSRELRDPNSYNIEIKHLLGVAIDEFLLWLLPAIVIAGTWSQGMNIGLFPPADPAAAYVTQPTDPFTGWTFTLVLLFGVMYMACAFKHLLRIKRRKYQPTEKSSDTAALKIMYYNWQIRFVWVIQLIGFIGMLACGKNAMWMLIQMITEFLAKG